MTTPRTQAARGRSHWLGLLVAIAAIAGLLAVAQPARAQTIDTVAPTSGSAAGGFDIVITGEDFDDPVSVTIGGVVILAADFEAASDTSITIVAPAHAVGEVDVTVTTEAGTSEAAAFTYLPEITSIDPTSGSESGGEEVELTGVGFTGATAVTFGGVAGTDIDVENDTTLRVMTPEHAPGAVEVRVTAGGETNADSDNVMFTFEADPPAITGIVPDEGPTAGGTVVTISGSGFTGATDVVFSVTDATDFTVIDDETISAVAPPHAAGTVFVRIQTPDGTSEDVPAAQFTYTTGGPLITILDPDEGPTGGGTVVTITGSGFEDVDAVMFGDEEAEFEVIDDTTIEATSPPHAAGTVFVIIETGGGDSSPTVASQFTFVEGPDVTGLDPDEGPAAGGTEVTITGTGFTDATSVMFGDEEADFDVVSDTEITATSPAGDPGAVQVVVTTEEGSSAEGDDSEFTYLADEDETISYTLVFRWTLISWLGTNGITVTNALSGTENPNNPDTNSIAGQVTAIYTWNAAQQRWLGNFPNAGNVPGANDFTTLAFGTSYFMAITGPSTLTWTVLAGP
jgi:hypothetical protein